MSKLYGDVTGKSGWPPIPKKPKSGEMSGPDWQEVAKGMGSSDKERLAIWMIDHGFATGHGDTLDDLLHELSWQVTELRVKVRVQNLLITELADALEQWCCEDPDPAKSYLLLVQRAREATYGADPACQGGN